MMSGWLLAWVLTAGAGLPVLAVAGIVWLCERSWGKKTGELGSLGFLMLGALLFLPLLLWIAFGFLGLLG